MAKLSEAEVLDVIRKALDDKDNIVTMASRIGSIEGWDSMGHLGILVALDEKFEGRVGEIEELATADSVQAIVTILRSHELV